MARCTICHRKSRNCHGHTTKPGTDPRTVWEYQSPGLKNWGEHFRGGRWKLWED